MKSDPACLPQAGRLLLHQCNKRAGCGQSRVWAMACSFSPLP